MPPIQAIIFDLDDTLYPERAYVSSGFAAVAKAHQDRLGDPVIVVARLTTLFDAGAPRHRVQQAARGARAR